MKRLIIVFIVLSVFIMGCVVTPPTSSAGVPVAKVTTIAHSVEQDNIQERLKIVNAPSTTMWFYGLSETGTVIFKSAVKGKVTSSGKRLEPIEAHPSDCGAYGNDGRGGTSCSSELLQADGTFGHSDEYVYWFDYEGNYFQWNGKYILTTKPLKINAPVIEFQQVTEAD